MIGLLTQRISVLSPRMSVSRAGDPVEDWSSPHVSHVVPGWVQPRSSSEDVAMRDGRGQAGRLYTTADAPITSGSRVVADGRAWEVVGPPRHVRTPEGRHHVEADVRWWEG